MIDILEFVNVQNREKFICKQPNVILYARKKLCELLTILVALITFSRQSKYSTHIIYFLRRETYMERSRLLPRQVVHPSVCLSVDPSVCNVEVSESYRLEFC